jgi:hypothetical protein
VNLGRASTGFAGTGRAAEEAIVNSRRKSLLLVLLVLLLLPLALGGIGTVELMVWVLLLAAWLVAFVVWARNPPPPPRHAKPRTGAA